MFRNILLVEDDTDDKDLFLHALKQIDPNINCWWAQNGEDALNILRADGNVLPECIFMDYNMPKVNGLECLKRIRKNEQLKHLPVIVLSTANDFGTQAKMKAAGSNAYITKPESIQKLVTILRFYLIEDNVKMLA